MRVSMLGPTNMKKFSKLIGRDQTEVEKLAKEIGRMLASQGCQLQVVFGYEGMLKLVADAYKEAGGKLTMFYTENDYDWETKKYLPFLKEAHSTIKVDSWHDMLLHLISDADIVLCAGLSAGVFAELAYIKWNHQDKKCRIKALVGIKELLREGRFPPEIGYDLEEKIVYVEAKDLPAAIRTIRNK